MRQAFFNKKNDAKGRLIPFLLTYEEFAQIWNDSGHAHERGPRKGQYVMARRGDVGPYAVGNVSIILATQNASEGRRGKTDHPDTIRLKQLASTGRKHSPKTIAKMKAYRLRWWSEGPSEKRQAIINRLAAGAQKAAKRPRPGRKKPKPPADEDFSSSHGSKRGLGHLPSPPKIANEE